MIEGIQVEVLHHSVLEYIFILYEKLHELNKNLPTYNIYTKTIIQLVVGLTTV